MDLLFGWSFFGGGFGVSSGLLCGVSSLLLPSLCSALGFRSIVDWNFHTQGLSRGINSSERLLVDGASSFLGQEWFDIGKDGGEVVLVQRIDLASDFCHRSSGSGEVGSRASVSNGCEGGRLADKSEGKNDDAEHDDGGNFYLSAN